MTEARRPLVVLATAHGTNGLTVTRTGRRLRVAVGGAEVVQVDSRGSRCAYTLRLADGRWTLRGGSVSKDGTAAMPIVDGLFSGLDLRAGARPAAVITTVVYATRSTLGQTVMRILAVLAAVAALSVVVPRAVVRRPRAVPRPRLVDVVVLLLLLVWWVIGPAYFDDGWIMAGEHNFLATGNFSAYYDSFGVASSLQYWLLWVQHWLFAASSSLLVLRVPSLLCLALTWLVCRWVLAQTPAGRSRAAVWALASMFAVGGLAWGMTIRPEPEVALLVAGVLACTVRFAERGTAAPLALAAVLIALAVSAHPAGLVAVAPLLAAAPRLLGWIRGHVAVAATIVLSALALGATLAFLGSDLAQFHANASTLRAHGAETAGWRDELTRYELLARPLYGAPLRREWVALVFLSVLAFLLRRRRSEGGLFAPALGIALLLLIITPAKIPWHFGALIGVAAVAVATETARLVDDARASPGWHVRPFIVIGAAMAAAAWSWFPRNAWSDLDLRTLSWTLGVEQKVTFAKLAGLVPLLLLASFVVVRRGRRADDAAWRSAVWIAPALAVPLIVFTVAVLVADARKTSGWTLTRQNLDTLRDDVRCGLADDALVPQLASMRTLPSVGQAPAGAARRLPAPPVENLARLVVGAASPSPWFRLPPDARTGFFVTGDPGAGDSLQVEWGRVHGKAVDPLGIDGVADPSLTDPSPDLVAWRFYPAGSLPSRRPGADAMRVALKSEIGPGGSIGVTAPVTYEDESLATQLERTRPALALPNLRTYVPCVDQPKIAGTAEMPRLIVAQHHRGTWPSTTSTRASPVPRSRR